MYYRKINEGTIGSLVALAVGIGGLIIYCKNRDKIEEKQITGALKKLHDLTKKDSRYKKFKDFKIKSVSINDTAKLLKMKDNDTLNNIGTMSVYGLYVNNKIIALYVLGKNDKEYAVKYIDKGFDKDFVNAAFEAYRKICGESLSKLIFYNTRISPIDNKIKRQMNKSIYYCTEEEYKKYEDIAKDAVKKIEKIINSRKLTNVKKINNGRFILSGDEDLLYDQVNDLMSDIAKSMGDSTDDIDMYDDVYRFRLDKYPFIEIQITTLQTNKANVDLYIEYKIEGVKIQESGMFTNVNLI